MHIEFTIDISSLIIGIIFGMIIMSFVWVSVDEQLLNKNRYHIGWHEGWDSGWRSREDLFKEKGI